MKTVFVREFELQFCSRPIYGKLKTIRNCFRWQSWTETPRQGRLCKRSASGWTWSERCTGYRRSERASKLHSLLTYWSTASASTLLSASTLTQVVTLRTKIYLVTASKDHRRKTVIGLIQLLVALLELKVGKVYKTQLCLK